MLALTPKNDLVQVSNVGSVLLRVCILDKEIISNFNWDGIFYAKNLKNGTYSVFDMRNSILLSGKLKK